MSDLLKLKSVFSPTNTKFQDNQSDLTTFPRQFDNDFKQTNLQNLDSMYNDGLGIPEKSNLQNLDSIYNDGLDLFAQSNLQDLNSKFDDGVGPLNATPDKSRQSPNVYNPPSLNSLSSIHEDDLRERMDDYTSNLVDNVANTKLDYNENSFIPQTSGFDVSMDRRGGRDNPILDSFLRGRVYEPIRFSQDFTNDSLFIKPEMGEVEEQLYKTQTFDPRSSTPKEGTFYFNTDNSFSPASNPTDFSTAGKQNEPYTPLNSILTDTFLEGLSWENLYNRDHTTKGYDDLGHMGLKPISYPNVSRDNLNIRNNSPGMVSQFSRTSLLGGGLLNLIGLGGMADALQLNEGGEPYIVSGISKSGTDMTGGRMINFGGRDFPLAPMVTDAVRLSKYLTSPNGIAFIAKQNALAMQTPNRRKTNLGRFASRENQKYKSIYNPLSSIIAAGFRAGGVPLTGIDKTQPNIMELVNPMTYPNFDKYADPLSPPMSYGNVYFRGNGSPLGAMLKYSWGKGRVKGNNIFISNFAATERNKAVVNAYADGDRYAGTKQPYKIVSGETEPPPGGGKLSPLYKLRNQIDSTPVKYTEDVGPSTSLNDSFYNGKVYGEDVQADKQSLLGKYNGGKARGDIHTLMQFGTSDDSVSTRLGRNHYFDKLEDAHPTDSKNGNILGTKSGMPFYFKDMRDNSFVFFRAYIDSLAENITPNWGTHNYIGRSEPVYTYESSERLIDFTFKVFAQTQKELSAIYEKINKLTSFCYPEYIDDNYGNRMKPPLVKFRMGEMYGRTNAELMGFVRALNYTLEQSAPWETKSGMRVPKYLFVTMTYQVIHAKVPNLKTQFYGFTGDNSMAGEYFEDPQVLAQMEQERLDKEKQAALSKEEYERRQAAKDASNLEKATYQRNPEDAVPINESPLVVSIGEVIDEYVPESIQNFAADAADTIEEWTGIDLNPFDDDGFLWW